MHDRFQGENVSNGQAPSLFLCVEPRWRRHIMSGLRWMVRGAKAGGRGLMRALWVFPGVRQWVCKTACVGKATSDKGRWAIDYGGLKRKSYREWGHIILQVVRRGVCRGMCWLSAAVSAESDRWMLWVPVGMALGIAWVFQWHWPPRWDRALGGIGLAGGGVLGALGWRTWWTCRHPQARDWPLMRFVAWGIFWGCVGASAALWRIHSLQTVMLDTPMDPVWITGRVIDLDHPASRTRLHQRVLLDIVPPSSARRFSATSSSSQPLASAPKPAGRDFPVVFPVSPAPCTGTTQESIPQDHNVGGYPTFLPKIDVNPPSSDPVAFKFIDGASSLEKRDAPGSSTVPLGRAWVTVRTASDPLYEGDLVRMKVHLRPFPGPCMPGGHDPRRDAFFRGIGATGFALTSPILLKRGVPATLTQHLMHARHTLTRLLHSLLPPPLGAVACGLVTGDKTALPEEVRQWFADSGLAHILAIAGLHVSILSGLCFFLLRRLLRLWPRLALHMSIDTLAMGVAFAAGGGYLVLSGGRYPAQRAFFMMGATALAMMMSRKRHAMRALMLCASVFLVLAPESLFNLSYQLSFSAVSGLIGFYEMRAAGWERRANRWRPRRLTAPPRLLAPWMPWIRRSWRMMRRGMESSFWASAIITVMTWPIMVFHFYHISLQGFLANLVAVPWTGLAVMPLGIVTLISLTTPWAGAVAGVWGFALQGLIVIARLSCQGLQSLIFPLCPPTGGWLFLQMGGLMWMVLWQKPWRWAGLVMMILCCVAGSGMRTQWQILCDPLHRMWAVSDSQAGILYVSSLRRGKLTAQRWKSALGLRSIAAMTSDQSWTTKTGWILRPHPQDGWPAHAEKAASTAAGSNVPQNTLNLADVLQGLTPVSPCFWIDGDGTLVQTATDKAWSLRPVHVSTD